MLYPVTVSIIGSYRKHLREMQKAINEFRLLGVRVRIPKIAKQKYSERGFVHLHGEPDGTPKQLQNKNFRHIANSTFVYIVNPRGYIGSSTAMELGYALKAGIPIFASQKPRDYIFTFYVKSGFSIENIAIVQSRMAPQITKARSPK